jgi:hypothetical protein
MSNPKSRKCGQDATEAESSRSPSHIEKMMEKIQLEEKLSPKLTLETISLYNLQSLHHYPLPKGNKPP